MKSEMQVILHRWTLEPDFLAGEAACICTDFDNEEKALATALDSHHDSVMEHCSFTFIVSGVSRVLLAQLTRHRIASFSVRSQRYVSYRDGFGYVIPPSIEALGEDKVAEYEAQMEQMHKWYCGWCNDLGDEHKEDARFVLPNACETKIMLTMNARELHHFLALRMCSRAQWEIRRMADEMYRQARNVAPMLFAKAGPGCWNSGCPEARPCKAPRKKYLFCKREKRRSDEGSI